MTIQLGEVETLIRQQHLELVEPTLALADEMLAMAQEYEQLGSALERAFYSEAIRDVRGYILRLRGLARGANVPIGYVPSTTYWLTRAGRTIVATSNLRHSLTPMLLHEGGHIGYGARPSERRKGYATLICALTIQRAVEMGLDRVLITCDADNVASARVIEKNGGVLENQVVSRQSGKLKNRYWVELPQY